MNSDIPRPPNPLGCGTIVLIVVGVLFLASRCAPEASAPEALEAPTKLGWTYSHDEDSISRKEITVASLPSVETIDQGRPYGISRLELSLRRHPRWGTDAYLRLERGQLWCRPSTGCSATVSFDGSEAVKYRLSEPDDASSDTLFLRDGDVSRFIARLKKAKRVVIEVGVFQHGYPTFTLPVAGLAW